MNESGRKLSALFISSEKTFLYSQIKQCVIFVSEMDENGWGNQRAVVKLLQAVFGLEPGVAELSLEKKGHVCGHVRAISLLALG